MLRRGEGRRRNGAKEEGEGWGIQWRTAGKKFLEGGNQGSTKFLAAYKQNVLWGWCLQYSKLFERDYA